MTTSHTSSGGASIVIDVMTSLMRAATLSRSQLFDALPLAQRMLDRGVEPVQADPEQLGGAVVAREQVAVEAAHQRGDERMVLAGDRGGHDAGDGREVEAEPDRRAPQHERVAD